MSIFNDAYSNEFRARFAKITAEEMWTKDESTGEYFRVSPGGGGSAPVELPAYLKPQSVEIAGAGTNTILDSNSLDVNDVDGNTGSSLTATNLTFGDVTGNYPFGKAGITIANKLATGAASGINILQNENQSLLIYNDLANTFLKSNAVQLTSLTANELTRIDPLEFSIRKTSTNEKTTITPHNFSIVNNAKNLVSIATGAVTCAKSTVAGGTVLDTTQPSVIVSSSNIIFRAMSLPDTLFTRADVIAANRIKLISPAVPIATSKMVTFDTSDFSFKYSDIPAGGTAPALYYKTVAPTDFPVVTWKSMPPTRWEHNGSVSCKTFTLNDGERVIFKCSSLLYDTWYTFKISAFFTGASCVTAIASNATPGSATANVSVVVMNHLIVPFKTAGANDLPTYCTSFKLINGGGDTAYGGQIIFEKVSGDTTVLPVLTWS